jgi:hypothetical protein
MPFVPDAEPQGRFVPDEPPDTRPASERGSVFTPDQVKPKSLVPGAVQSALELAFPGVNAGESVLALAEQPAAGLYGTVQMAYGGAKGLYKAALAKAAGLPFGETFSEEYNNAHKDLPEYVPLTPAGGELTKKMSQLMESGLGVLGEVGYTSNAKNIKKRLEGKPTDEVNPAGGAIAQALGMAALLAAGPGKKGKASDAKPAAAPAPDPIQAFAERYPLTASALDASKVGKIDLKPLEPDKPIQTATKRVDQAYSEALDAELGPGVDPSIPLSDKIKLVVMKYGAEVPMADKIKVANAYADRSSQSAGNARCSY